MREPTAAEVRKQLEELETTYRQRKRRLRALLGVLELDEKQEPES